MARLALAVAAVGALSLLAGPQVAQADDAIRQVAVFAPDLSANDVACGLNTNANINAASRALRRDGVVAVTSAAKVPSYLQVHLEAGTAPLPVGCAAVLKVKMQSVIDFQLPSSARHMLAWAVVCERTDLVMGSPSDLAALSQRWFERATDQCVAQIGRNAK